jgi:hypothetical protein
MVDNVGLAVGIATTALAVQKLFPLPIFGRHIEFGNASMSLDPSPRVMAYKATWN